MKTIALAAVALAVTSMPLVGQEAPRSRANDPNVENSVGRIARADRSDKPSVLQEGIADAIETVEGACAADISFFCRRVTPGEGRLALCMRAHENQLGGACRRALHQAVSSVA